METTENYKKKDYNIPESRRVQELKEFYEKSALKKYIKQETIDKLIEDAQNETQNKH